MVKDFIVEYVKLIAKHPESVSIDSNTLDENLTELLLYVHPDDIGKVIGKDGRMISSIKTVISGCKPKGGPSYKVSVKAKDAE
ncbi:MAG TPA: KH domain-containing protein [Nitratifractor sp.]|nr:KH domain-containing protein [Nitratifractor sp.]